MRIAFLENFILRILEKVPLPVIFWGSILTLVVALFIIFKKMLDMRGE